MASNTVSTLFMLSLSELNAATLTIELTTGSLEPTLFLLNNANLDIALGPTLLQLEGTADNSPSVSGFVDGTTVAGTITASPALAVSVGFGIWPSNSIAQGASYQLAAGSTSGTFSLTVPAGTAVSRAEAMQILRQRR